MVISNHRPARVANFIIVQTEGFGWMSESRQLALKIGCYIDGL